MTKESLVTLNSLKIPLNNMRKMSLSNKLRRMVFRVSGPGRKKFLSKKKITSKYK